MKLLTAKKKQMRLPAVTGWQTRFSSNLWTKRVVVSAAVATKWWREEKGAKKKKEVVVLMMEESGTQPPRKCPEPLVHVAGDRAGCLDPVSLM